MTNIVEFESRAAIEHQAREWLIRLDGDEPLTARETVALREWMARSPAHRQELTRICRFWREANILTELAVPLRPPDLGHNVQSWRGVRVAVAAAALLACALLGWWGLQRFREPVSLTYATAVGEHMLISLPDGSAVELNTDTQVQALYTNHLRRIRLWRGEALFSVTRDASRPFEVYANDSVIRAVGTAFSVHLEGTRVDVTVTAGVVDVGELDRSEVNTLDSDRRPARSARRSSLGLLKAGQTTTVAGSDQPVEVKQLPVPELQRRMAWQSGYLAFSGEPLSEVVEQINRYSAVTLSIGDPHIATVAIGGRFRIGDLEGILDALHTNFGVQAHALDERHIRLESVRHP